MQYDELGFLIPERDTSDSSSPTGKAEPVADWRGRALLEEILLSIRGLNSVMLGARDQGLDLDAFQTALSESLRAPDAPLAPDAFPLPNDQLDVLLEALLVRSEPALVGLTNLELRGAPVEVVATFDKEQLRDLRAAMVPTSRGSTAVTGFPANFVVNDRLKVQTDTEAQAVPAETLLDFTTRTDGNPVYVGTNLVRGTGYSSLSWDVKRLTYDTSNRVIKVEVRSSIAWQDRATGW